MTDSTVNLNLQIWGKGEYDSVILVDSDNSGLEI